MKAVRLFVVFFTVGLVTGCGTFPPPDLEHLSNQELRTVTDRNLCEAYFYGQGKKVRREINRRDLIPSGEWTFVERQAVRQGMRECSLRAAFGAPDEVIAKTSSDPEQVFVYNHENEKLTVTVSRNRVKSVKREPLPILFPYQGRP